MASHLAMTEETCDNAFLDDYTHPDPSLLYTPENIPGKGCDESVFEDNLAGCTCSDSCPLENGPTCPCCADGPNYRDGLFLHLNTSKVVIECSDRCSCGTECQNRLVQKGPCSGLVIKSACDRGLGLFSGRNLAKGQVREED